MTMSTRHEIILATVTDMVSNLMYYDRKAATEGLRLGDIEAAIKAGEITVSDIVTTFENEVREHLHG